MQRKMPGEVAAGYANWGNIMDHLSLETMQQHIRHADDLETLRAFRNQFSEIIPESPLFNHPLRRNELVNQLHDGLIRRTIALAERSLFNRGMGLPQVSYAVVLFGSGGRSEQTLWSDQDNGIIYADPETGRAAEAETYFRSLAGEIVDSLIRLGYPPCGGNVLCRNPLWRKTVSAWKETISCWMADPSWENARYALIFADLRCIYGDDSLADQVKRNFFAGIAENRLSLHHLLNNTLHRKVSLGVFGQLIPERYGEEAGGIDVKYGSYIPLINAIRLLAIQSGLEETSTRARIEALSKRRLVPDRMAADWKRALSINCMLRSLAPHYQESGLHYSTGKLPVRLLTKEMRRELKFCLRTGRRLHKYVKSKIEQEA